MTHDPKSDHHHQPREEFTAEQKRDQDAATIADGLLAGVLATAVGPTKQVSPMVIRNYRDKLIADAGAAGGVASKRPAIPRACDGRGQSPIGSQQPQARPAGAPTDAPKRRCAQ